ncbi:MAG: hypothetical protein J2P17_32075 [Mycobacterium sp.]|nr:hypothetical protein [Mycobacterium sp.]
MARTATITQTVVECAPRLVAAPWAAIIGIILLLDRIFDVFLGTGTPAGVTIQRLGGVPARRSRGLQSDTAGVQQVTPTMSNHTPMLIRATVQHSDGGYVGVNESWAQGHSLRPGDGDGKGLRYQSDYRPGQLGSKTMGIVRVQQRENEE